MIDDIKVETASGELLLEDNADDKVVMLATPIQVNRLEGGRLCLIPEGKGVNEEAAVPFRVYCHHEQSSIFVEPSLTREGTWPFL